MSKTAERTHGIDAAAAELGVAPITMRSWIKRKPPCPHRRDKRGWLFFSIPEVAAWMKTNNITGDPGRPSETSAEMKAERLRHVKAMADWWTARVDKERGELISRSEVEAGRIARVQAVKAKLMELPGLAFVIVGKTANGIEAELTEWAKGVCEHFAARQPGDDDDGIQPPAQPASETL
jgi:hypothetical protein